MKNLENGVKQVNNSPEDLRRQQPMQKGPDIRKVKKGNTTGAIISAILVTIFFFGGYLYMRLSQPAEKEVNLSDVVSQIQEKNATDVIIRENRIFVDLKQGEDNGKNKKIYAFLQDNADAISMLEQEGITVASLSAEGVNVSVQPVSRVNWVDIVSIVFMGLLAGGVFLFVRNMQNSGNKLLDFGQSGARLIFGKKSNIGFKDVAGIKESKEELIELVQFLKNPNKFTKLGARIPKGVLLVGPPGSGKTLLARAVAGEAGVPFFHTSGSEFEEMLVGAGASRVRDLFKKARRVAPCIIFIDEIDAVAKKRGTTLHSGNTEQTLNQILVEMDGLEPRTNVIVMAATNRPDVLDPAILRPGRFDRTVVLTLPDANEREDILKIHAKNKKLAKDVDLGSLARRTIGYSGADLENVLNEAAIIAAKSNESEITNKDLDEATLKVKYGPERKSKIRSEEDVKMTAYHEAGHALVAYFTPGADPVHGVSIISRGMSGGLTMFQPEKDRDIITKKRMAARITVSAAGNVAEKIKFNDISTGAAADINNATSLARDMVKKYGMSSKLGFVQYGNMDESEYLGYGYETKQYSDETARDIDLEVKRIVDEAWNNAETILTDHEDMLNGLADLLLKEEVLDAKEFEDFVKNFKKKK